MTTTGISHRDRGDQDGRPDGRLRVEADDRGTPRRTCRRAPSGRSGIAPGLCAAPSIPGAGAQAPRRLRRRRAGSRAAAAAARRGPGVRRRRGRGWLPAGRRRLGRSASPRVRHAAILSGASRLKGRLPCRRARERCGGRERCWRRCAAGCAGCSDDEPDGAVGRRLAGPRLPDVDRRPLRRRCKRTDADATVTVLSGDGMTLPAADFVSESPERDRARAAAPDRAARPVRLGHVRAPGGRRRPVVGGDRHVRLRRRRSATTARRPRPRTRSHSRSPTPARSSTRRRWCWSAPRWAAPRPWSRSPRGVDVDGWVDVSGAGGVGGDALLLDLAPDVQAARPPRTGGARAGRRRAAVRRRPGSWPRRRGPRFLDGQSDHGWFLLNDNQGTLRPGRPGRHRLRERGPGRLTGQAPAVSRFE